MTSETIKINHSDCDSFYELKVSTIFHYFQDIATKDIARVNASPKQLLVKGLDWVISRMNVEIIRMPKCDEIITIYTYPGDDMKVIYPRYFFIKDEHGNTIIKASSLWALINNKTRKPIFSSDAIDKLPSHHETDELQLPDKIKEIDTNYVESRKIHYSDIDVNGHVNNSHYVEFLVDLKNIDFYKKYRISKIYLNYLKELLDEQIIDVFESNCNPNFIKVAVNQDKSFIGEITYIER